MPSALSPLPHCPWPMVTNRPQPPESQPSKPRTWPCSKSREHSLPQATGGLHSTPPPISRYCQHGPLPCL